MTVFDIEPEMGSMDSLISLLLDLVTKALLPAGLKRVGGTASVLTKSIMAVAVRVTGSVNHAPVNF